MWDGCRDGKPRVLKNTPTDRTAMRSEGRCRFKSPTALTSHMSHMSLTSLTPLTPLMSLTPLDVPVFDTFCSSLVVSFSF